jgi:putative exporter of polyketide antibiotics
MNQQQIHFVQQQLRRHAKSIIIWIIIWTLVGLLFASVFKTLSATAEQSSRIYQALPPAILKAVNISTDYLTRPEKFLSGQFLTVYLLAGSIFSVFMGVGAIGGKIYDKTISNFLTKPLSRGVIYMLQALVNGMTIVAMSLGVTLTMYTSFRFLSGTHPSTRYFVALWLGSVLIFWTFAALGQLAGVVLQKTRAEAFGGALAVFSFFINGLGSLAGVPTWLQKCSLYYYFDTVKLRDVYSLDITKTVILVGIATVFVVAGMTIFRRKDLHL